MENLYLANTFCDSTRSGPGTVTRLSALYRTPIGAVSRKRPLNRHHRFLSHERRQWVAGIHYESKSNATCKWVIRSTGNTVFCSGTRHATVSKWNMHKTLGQAKQFSAYPGFFQSGPKKLPRLRRLLVHCYVQRANKNMDRSEYEFSVFTSNFSISCLLFDTSSILGIERIAIRSRFKIVLSDTKVTN